MFRKFLGAWRRRALPVSWSGLHRMKCCYSQFGEDALLEAMTQSRDKVGFYVDVGCFEPILLSNTYKLYLQGWRGIVIDPNADMEPLWRKHRHRDQFVCCAVGEQTGKIGFHKNSSLPNESCLDTSGKGITVPIRRLDDILDAHVPSGTTIDVMSIDCEGFDLSVVKSNNVQKYRPKVLIVEDLTHGKSELAAHVEALNYELVGMTVQSLIYSSRE